jgi:hypothetical protein
VLDMRFLGGKRGKIKETAKATAMIQSFRHLGFTPAFGRAVGRFAARLDAGLKPSSISKATASARTTARARATATATATADPLRG